MKNVFLLMPVLLILIKGYSINGYSLSATNCPTSCSCSLNSDLLTISGCSQVLTMFSLPLNFVSDPGLSIVTSISAVNCLIQSFPSNICLYPNLKKLDLSSNQIAALNDSNFECLKSLTTIILNNNSIASIDSNTFKSQANLSILNLSNNKISQIPQGLFYTHLVNLNSIDLSYNLLTSMELWPTYLTNIVFIDLKHNLIEKFTNQFAWFLSTSSNLPALSSTATLDLQYNLITSLDDKTIEQYGICSFTDYASFINKYFNVFWVDNNPIVCNCANSQRLIADTKMLVATNKNLTMSNLYSSHCSSPAIYARNQVLSFDNCLLSINYPYCVTPTTKTTSKALITTNAAVNFTKLGAKFKQFSSFLIFLIAINVNNL